MLVKRSDLVTRSIKTEWSVHAEGEDKREDRLHIAFMEETVSEAREGEAWSGRPTDSLVLLIRESVHPARK